MTLKPREGSVEALRATAHPLRKLAEALAITRPLVGLDLEATGPLRDHDRICEVSMVKLRPDGKFAVFSTLVNPGMPIPSEATEIHGISDAMVADAPAFADVAAVVSQGLRDCALVGYNLRGYDVPLLMRELAQGQHPIELDTQPILDGFSVFQQREPRDLDAARAFYQVLAPEDAHAHRAADDVYTAVSVLLKQIARYDDLPRTVTDLATYCDRKRNDYVDRAGKFRLRGGVIIVAFGKYVGTPIADMDDGFLKWMLDKDFESDTTAVVRDELDRRQPQRPLFVDEAMAKLNK